MPRMCGLCGISPGLQRNHLQGVDMNKTFALCVKVMLSQHVQSSRLLTLCNSAFARGVIAWLGFAGTGVLPGL